MHYSKSELCALTAITAETCLAIYAGVGVAKSFVAAGTSYRTGNVSLGSVLSTFGIRCSTRWILGKTTRNAELTRLALPTEVLQARRLPRPVELTRGVLETPISKL
jgi:hypothetical protein